MYDADILVEPIDNILKQINHIFILMSCLAKFIKLIMAVPEEL